ncbi:condensation domain-containing protein [Actinosynnema sp. NPDC053489]|uniref:condensation domain-containing protein n=1 Tax=Actinosynnema sp. NPDC053489 TaxID=3363916 RepID=UPI0037CB4E6D
MRYPLSYAQRRAWEDPAPPLACAFLLEGEVDRGRLQRAADAVAARHAALRTRFAVSGGLVEQVVAPSGGIEVRPDPVDVAAEPFDLDRGPLVRAALVAVGTGRWRFELVAHRLVADDVSVAIVLADLAAAYRTGVLPAQPWLDYGDYAVWQRERLRGEELERQLVHWREALRDAPAPFVRPAFPGESLTAVARGSAEAVFAAYALVLARHTRQEDVVVGVPVSGRMRVELEPVVGPFADVVPVRVPLAGVPTFEALLGRVREAVAGALAHAELPVDKLAEELGTDLPGHAVRFAFEPPVPPVLDLPGVRSRVVGTTTTGAALELRAEDDVLTLEHRVDRRFAGWLLRSVVAVLDHVDRAPDARLADLPPTDHDLPPATAPTAATPPERRPPEHRPPAEPPAASGSPGRSREQVEAAMVDIWAELLRTTEPIGVHDNLFGLGVGSLTAVRFAARVADTYGVTLPLHRIIGSPTIAALADVVAAELAPVDAGDDLAGLSDDELDALLRAVTAARERRRAGGGDAR